MREGNLLVATDLAMIDNPLLAVGLSDEGSLQGKPSARAEAGAQLLGVEGWPCVPSLLLGDGEVLAVVYVAPFPDPWSRCFKC